MIFSPKTHTDTPHYQPKNRVVIEWALIFKTSRSWLFLAIYPFCDRNKKTRTILTDLKTYYLMKKGQIYTIKSPLTQKRKQL